MFYSLIHSNFITLKYIYIYTSFLVVNPLFQVAFWDKPHVLSEVFSISFCKRSHCELLIALSLLHCLHTGLSVFSFPLENSNHSSCSARVNNKEWESFETHTKQGLTNAWSERVLRIKSPCFTKVSTSFIITQQQCHLHLLFTHFSPNSSYMDIFWHIIAFLNLSLRCIPLKLNATPYRI